MMRNYEEGKSTMTERKTAITGKIEAQFYIRCFIYDDEGRKAENGK